ncbi:MAG: hypothetical protein PHU85_17480 [Phycisphaerae bacterium]|nr:hypothetical protein [Phycisphaerae bacterium]
MKRTWMLTAAMSAMLAIVLGGCKAKQQGKEPAMPGMAGKETPKATPPPRLDTPVEPPLVGRDSLDSTDAKVAGLFPRTGQVGKWVKGHQVTLHAPDDLEKMVDKEAPGYRAAGVDWAADMMYQLDKDESKQAFVQLFHCAKAKDAYSLLTVNSAQPCKFKFGGGTEARGNAPDSADQIFVWKGEYLLCVWTAKIQPDSVTDAMQQLASAIVAKLPAATGGKGDLVTALPARGEKESAVRYYLGRHWLAAYNSALDQETRLESDDEMVVAEYEIAKERPPVVVFVARYGSPEKAVDAAKRLTTAQNDANTAFQLSLLVGGVKGRCVFGTLTADEYGLMEKTAGSDSGEMPVMPTLKDRLP